MRLAWISAFFMASISSALAAVDVPVVYLERQVAQPPTLSNLDPVPEDLGEAGARLGLADNLTTGRFLGQNYTLIERIVPGDGDFLGAAREVLAQSKLVIVSAPADDLLAVADLPEAADALLFNGSAQETRLRDEACRANVLHTITSYAMRADALAQFFSKRQWSDWALVTGPHPDDAAFADALKASAQKFGLKIRDEKTWDFDADMRRNAAQDVPVFTQSLKDHDVLLVADEVGDFGRYVLYNTWDPRPVGGSEGVTPKAWAPVVEQWGAAQLQGRFTEQSGRKMQSEDYGVWAAMRTIGEAVTRTGKADPAALREYILSDKFELAGFKGRTMTYRPWNGQLRQPVPLVHARALVALAPLDGFLHQHTELDTLGIDGPETQCQAFNG